MTSHPLNCYSGLSNDDFAGWYAVKDKRKCNDFCFWKQPDEYYYKEEKDMNNSMNSTSSSSSTYSTADPHQSTIIMETNAKWVCLFDSASDKTMFDIIHQQNNENENMKVFYDEDILKFDPLRCTRGAGEVLHSNGQIVVSSISFWSIVTVTCIIIFVLQIVSLIMSRRKWRRMKYFQSLLDENDLQLESNNYIVENDNQDDEDVFREEQNPTPSSPSSRNNSSISNTTQSKPKCRSICFSKRTCRITTLIIFDIALIYILFTAILVITEIDQRLDLPFSLQILTPPCSNTELLCAAANMPIDNPSKSRNESLSREGSSANKSFSYIIASDSQLNWYDGESAYIGMQNYPPPCSSRDSCGSCTKKLGLYTNQQMKKSIEKLIKTRRGMDNNNTQNDSTLLLQMKDMNNLTYANEDYNNSTYEDYPIPKTLIMNGDLTQYFHRHERKKYESIYHNIEGLEQYFPSLGNHDYDQKNGATYDNDEWVGPHYCNGKHAVSYLKGSFCNKIPKFDAQRRLTRYDPKSLSYSWEEGLFHFVQVHYYPTFENAGIGISSSIEWLERDLRLANEQDLTSILFVHASSGLPDILEDTLLDNNVAAIFTGHLHRCFGRKCELVRGLDSNQAEKFINSTMTNSTPIYQDVGPCFPSSAMLCSKNARGNGLFYVKDIDQGLTLPKRKLFSKVPVQRGLCPVSKYGPYLNETGNTSLCRRISIRPQFPRIERNDKRSIPIFWSGSASYETFLVADFHHDRIVVNAMTASEGSEGERYIDSHTLPNAIYPFHQSTELDEQTVFI